MKKQSSKTRIIVLGSLNMDVVLRLDSMPARGETVHAQSLSYIPGGKGGNQAVACVRHGAQVALVGCVGRDAHGDVLRNALAADGVDVSHVAVHDGEATGSAVVMVEADGSNRIAVIPGANALAALPAHFAQVLAQADYLVVQFETPLDVLDSAIAMAHQNNCKVVLNPSPVKAVPSQWWPLIDTLVVNEHEAAELSGMAVVDADTAQRAAQHFLGLGVRQVVVTMGSQGALALNAQGHSVHPAPQVNVVDTTSAGDTFLGTMVTRLGEGCTLPHAVEWGIKAAALCIGRAGAQPSIPQRSEVGDA
jgi:ribokinase